MAKQIDLEESECPVARSLEAIGDRWSLLIVRDAFNGVSRFCEFQRSLGVARGILATRLRRLVELGVLEVVPLSESAFQEYVLTPRGRDLFPIVVGLRQWGESHLYDDGEVRSQLVAREDDRPVGKLELRSEDGRLLQWADTVVKQPIKA